MERLLKAAWIGLRDRFASRVLGTTSPDIPGLGGGLPLITRLAAVVASLAVATIAGRLGGGPFGTLFFFPALMLAGLWGGAALAAAAYGTSLLLAAGFFAGADLPLFAVAAGIQTAAAVLLRLLFRESRRWGVRYRRLLSAISSAVTVSDGRGRIFWPHPDLARLIGLEWPSYRGTGWLASVHPEDRAKLAPSGPFKDVALQSAEIRLKDPCSGDWRWHLMRAVPLLDARGEVEEWISVLTDVHERKLSGEQRDMVVGEARHRLKNLMTIIDSLVKSSRPRDADEAVMAFQKKILGRLHALSAASDLVLANNFSTMSAREVVAATLSPFLEAETGRLSFGGPDLQLREATGGSLALGVHELTTNAIKHGALSVPEGRVAFTWSVSPAREGRLVEMIWKESGGPPPKKPEKDGFGTRVIAFIPSREMHGKVAIEYPPDGYVCRIAFTMPDTVRVTAEVE
ncbi:MAG TPA: HWE histidine kinase domain-containing protein [Rhizomicrobium sp.]